MKVRNEGRTQQEWVPPPRWAVWASPGKVLLGDIKFIQVTVWKGRLTWTLYECVDREGWSLSHMYRTFLFQRHAEKGFRGRLAFWNSLGFSIQDGKQSSSGRTMH